MTIVCGTDFSPGAEPAILAAHALARGLGESELWLVHALDPAVAEAEGGAAAEAGLRSRLEARAARLAGSGPVRVRAAVVRGPASEALLEAAAARHARLLVVASRGHAQAARYRLGGTSERVANAADLPVVVVRDAAPFVAWAGGERALRVLVGVDESASSEPAVRWVKTLRAHGPCDVVLGHVFDATAARRRYGLESRSDEAVEPLIRRDLERFAGDLGGSGSVTIRAKPGFGPAGDPLLELAESERADLVVLGTHGARGLARWTSVSNLVLHDSRASVVVVPRTAAAEEAEIPTLRRVLVATDLSEFANRAIRYAYALLADRGGELFLAHVLPAKATADDESETAARLRALVPGTATERGVVTRTEVVRADDVARALCEAGARAGADLVCVASHGRGGLGRVALGSVAEAMLRQTRCPVMVVRPPRA
jgi:nucleotide-binding universal stress UspA family protein